MDVYTDDDGSTYSHVTVIDTVQQEVRQILPVNEARGYAVECVCQRCIRLICWQMGRICWAVEEALLMLLLPAVVQIVARVRAGPALVHGYSVFEQNEFWAHSDAE